MDPYEVLGITRSATRDQITVAYRRKARQWHPDINKSPEATEQFQRIQLAHDKLTGKVPYVDTTRRTSEAPHASTYRPSYGVFIDTEMLQRIQREALLNLLRALSETPAQRRERERVERVRLIQQERERVARLRLAEKERVERLRAAQKAERERERVNLIRLRQQEKERVARLRLAEKERVENLRRAEKERVERLRAAKRAAKAR